MPHDTPPTSHRPSPIERHLEVTPSPDPKIDVFVNKYPLWRLGTKGIFGGIAIAQSLRAAQSTVDSGFNAHSMHCSFVFAGGSETPIFYHVERVRNGRRFCTRTVRAMQGELPIFLATVSFTRLVEQPKGTVVEHAEPIPPNVPFKDRNVVQEFKSSDTRMDDTPYVNKSVGVRQISSTGPQAARMHQWVKSRGCISSTVGQDVHLAALAFMSDSYFLAAVPHSHGILVFESPPATEFYESSHDIFSSSESHTKVRRPHLEASRGVLQAVQRVTMMVSLDHAIYFHNPQCFKADEWLLTEVQSSWAGDGRGLVYQRMWTKNGILVATCVQEVPTIYIASSIHWLTRTRESSG